jgi:sugar lactone lactonase YvrE
MKRVRLPLLLLIACGACGGVGGQVQTIYEPYSITTLAGTPPGSADGTGSNARLDGPVGMAADNAGNIYVADANNSTIRKITPGGVVTTLAGSAGHDGNANGTGDKARFFFPRSVAVDSSGNIYVADSNNYTIRKVTPEAIVTTIAGLAGVAGSADGSGSAARFDFPIGIALDGDNTLYVTDGVDNTIRKILLTPGAAATVSTFAGSPGQSGNVDGTGSAAHFTVPSGVAVDGAGNVFVADSQDQTIRKITTEAVVSTFAGTPGTPGRADGTGQNARFNLPVAVAIDKSDNIYVADSSNQTIRQVTPDRVVTTLAGSPGEPGNVDGIGDTARFNRPRGVTVTNTGNVYVADGHNNTIRQLTPARAVSTFAGLSGAGSVDGLGVAARFNFPNGVAVDAADNLYIADVVNDTIRKIDPNGFVTTLAGMPGVAGSADGKGGAAQFNLPRGIAVDSLGNVYVGDWMNNTIRKVTPDGVVTTLAGAPPPALPGNVDGIGSEARFNNPYGVAVNAAGTLLYVADSQNDTIRKITFTANGEACVTPFAGNAAHPPGSNDGTGLAARFDMPEGVALDSAGNLYVADNLNDTIRKITPEAVVTTLAGLAGDPNSVDATGEQARFWSPKGVAVDSAGNVYVGDSFNDSLRKVTPDGKVSTLAGSPGRAGALDGPGSVARFDQPAGTAIDKAGRLFVVDGTNSTIRVGVAAPPVIKSITSPDVVTAVVGNPFVYQFQADGAQSLKAPDSVPGLMFDSTLSAVKGTPTAAGSYQIELSASNAIGETTGTLLLNVQPAPFAEGVVVSGAGATGATGHFFSYQVRAAGFTSGATVTANTLPAGLTMNPVTGIISGVLPAQLFVDPASELTTSIPAQDGSSLIILTVQDNVSQVTSTLDLTFTSDTSIPVISSPSEATLLVGRAFTYTIFAPSSADPVSDPTTYAYDGVLPAGLTFDTKTGTISGSYNPQAERTPSTRVWKGLAGGPPNFVGSVQLFARNSKGTGTIPLLFTLAPPGAGNLSTRLKVGAGDDALIGGFIIDGNAPKQVLLRAIGPSLNINGVPLADALQDTTLELHDSHGLLLLYNDDWRLSQEAEILATSLAPPNDRESAILCTLIPGSYTAILRGKNNATGIGLVEVYDLGTASLNIESQSQLVNISTRGNVQTGDDIMIGGFIIEGNSSSDVVIRALGPELTGEGVFGALQDPVLDLYDSNGVLLASNDDWESAQEAELLFTGLAPSNPHESAILQSLEPGSYSATVSGKNGSTGVALMEVYVLP